MLQGLEKIDEIWMRDLLNEKKEIRSAGGQSPVKFIEYFGENYWDKIPEERQKLFAEVINKLLQSDLPVYYPREKHAYLVNLIDLACFLERKISGSISTNSLLQLRDKNYTNIEKQSYANPQTINEEIERAFLPKEYYKHRFENKDYPFGNIHRSFRDGTSKLIPYMQELWQIKKRLYPEWIDRDIQAINELLKNNDIPSSIQDKGKWLTNLLEYSFYIEKDMPGSIQANSITKWLNNFSLIPEQKFRDKLSKLFESFLK